MILGFQAIAEIMHQRQTEDLRTAAFVCALQKMVTSYQELGVWP
ncbi:MAG: hypothetical protein ETSY1_07705 [Candidatus Entotheonella factor]|uniref:Uncharacterized protein n=1 Tax=Entotheonella factor TaxID=1429438 RepID=W4LTN2_ENTF1|nr:MAG: hypothetical protein ETSY1_07705 [Candidatus Entotheonella factor]